MSQAKSAKKNDATNKERSYQAKRCNGHKAHNPDGLVSPRVNKAFFCKVTEKEIFTDTHIPHRFHFGQA